MRNPTPLLILLSLVVGCAHGPVPQSSGSSNSTSTPIPWNAPARADDVRVELASAMLESDRPESALKIVRKAHDDGLDGVDLTVIQAQALLKQGLLTEAEALLNEVVRRQPRHRIAHAELGVLYLEQERIDDALTALRLAVRLDPREAKLRNNLGIALLNAGQYAEAEVELREAVRINPTHGRYRNNLGFALAASGRIAEARETFQAVVGARGAEHNLRVADRLYPPAPTPEDL